MIFRFTRPIHFAMLLMLAALAAIGSATLAAASPLFPPDRFAAIVLDAETGEEIYGRNADAARFPASLTKVMTIYLAFDAIDHGDLRLDDTITMSAHAASRPPSKLGLRAGQQLTVCEALNVLVVKSANDVASALAERIGGSEAKFADMMNAKARALGMRRTHFVNASGLPNPGRRSSARDMAILGRAFLRAHPQDYRIFDQERTSFRGRVIPGHNALLKVAGIDGFKTGYTNASGFNLLTSGTGNGHRAIAVVLGGATARARDRYMADLMEASFAYLGIRDAGIDTTVAQILKGKTPIPALMDARTPLQGSQLAALSSPAIAQGDESTLAEREPTVW